MNSIIKQRIVGSMVLLALGVVFWPIIFVQPIQDNPLILAPAPVPPVVDTTPIKPIDLDESTARKAYQAPRVDPKEQAAADSATLVVESAAKALIDASQQLPRASDMDPPTVRKTAFTVSPVDASGYANSWVLQVAALETQSRANALVEQLQAKGYEAFARALKRDNRPLWRVQIGPKLEREKLTKIKPAVDSAFGVNATILRYEQ